jgi:hypothetical protein
MSNPLEFHEHDEAIVAAARDLGIHRSTVSDLMPTA